MTQRQQLVAFLRGINVGAAGKGRKSVPMAKLREVVAGLGYGDVQTYIQSGNVLFTGSQTNAEQKLEQAIANEFGCDVPVIVRPARELLGAEAKCPFAAAAAARPNLVHIGFAKGRVRPAMVAALADYCANGERVALEGQFIWTDCPNGVARSKLTPSVLDRAFGSSVTLRNVKTLRAIGQLLGAGA